MEGDEIHPNWREWFNDHGSRLLLFARQQTRCFEDAEDALQEAIIRAWKKSGSHETPPLWEIFAAIRRIAIDQVRRETRRLRREEQSVDPTESTLSLFESNLEEREKSEMIESAINQLPGPQREVVTLRIWGELTFEQIALALSISPNTAASRYRYALQNLRKQLQVAPIDAS